MEEGNVFTCKLCLKSSAKYTCPRCNVRYCSSECYKSKEHLECSELFYRNCVMEGLRSMDADDGERHRMAEMLKRFEMEDSVNAEESDGVPDLAERVSGIDLDQDPEKVLDILTPEEIKEFEALLKDGEKSDDIVELWNPWWCEDRPTFLEEVPSNDNNSASIPALVQGIEVIEKLLKTKKPSETIAFDIINALFGYAYVTRLYNGDHQSLSVESAESMVSLSLSLQQMQFSDVALALGSCIACTVGRDQSIFVSSEYSIAVVRDVFKILVGPNTLNPLLYVMAALSDSQTLFRSARKKILKSKRKKELQQQVRLFCAVQKKLEFYMSWVRAYGLALKELIPLVELELCTLSTELASVQTENGKIQMLLEKLSEGPCGTQSKKLIEEL